MAWTDIDPAATDRAFDDMAAHPPPVAPPTASTWAKVGAFMRAPLEGTATAVNETARVANTITGYLDTAGKSAQRHDGPFEAQRMKSQQKARDQVEATDDQLRSGVEYWKPDPITASTASSLLFGASRVLTKVAGYSMLGAGMPAAAALTGVDEGTTTAQQLQDRGVAPGTAAKVGAVHGVVTAASVVLPVVGRTIAETVGLVAAGGPGSFMAEQALSRHILETAHYDEIAKEFDPSDRTGLAISTLIPAVVGSVAHAVRARAPVSPEVVDAAHVVFAKEAADSGALARPDDVTGMQAHHDTLQAVREVMDRGDPVDVLPTAQVDIARATEVMQHASERMRVDREAMPERQLDAFIGGNPEVAGMVDVFHQLADDVAAGRTSRASLDSPTAPHPEIRALAGAVLDRPELYDHVIDYLEAIPDGVSMRDAAISAQTRVAEINARFDVGQVASTTAHADPVIANARQIAAERPDLPVRLGTGEDAQTMSARDYLDHIEAQAQNDRTEARAYAAAVECFLARGAE